MGFMDELKRLAHPYEDEDEDDFEEFEPAPRAAVPERRDRSERMDRTGSLYSAPVEPERRSNKVVNIHTTTQLQVVLVKPERFENASEIADHLREKRTVVLNLESTTRRSPAACWIFFPAWPMPTRARSRRWPSPPISPPTMWTSWGI